MDKKTKGNKNLTNEDEINLREIFKIFSKRKWWFIGAFIIVLIVGLTLIYIKPVNYQTTYQFEFIEEYSNRDLSNLYPVYQEKLNSITLEEVHILFNSVSFFESIDKLLPAENINYSNLLNSGVVKISLNEDTPIFDLSVSNPDLILADSIGLTLINAFNKYISNKIKVDYDDILYEMEVDLGELEKEKEGFEKAISDIEEEANGLYSELDEYIIDYNINLMDSIEEKVKDGRFYNIVVPHNKIQDDISILIEKIKYYEIEILNNERRITELNNLYDNIIKDEDIIRNRIELVSEDPVINAESNRKRSLAIVLVLSVVAGVIVTSGVNFLLNSKNEKVKK